MNNNKQSSVDWLVNQYSKYCDDSQVPFEVFEQAKAMHKQEMVNFAFSWSHDRAERIDIEEDYNETFKNNQ